MKFKNLIAGLLLSFISLFADTGSFYQIEKQTAQELLISFHFPEPEIVQCFENPQFVVISIPGLIQNYEDAKPLLPVLSTSIVVPPGKIALEVLSEKTEVMPGLRPARYFRDDVDVKNSQVNDQSEFYPKKYLSLKEAGIFRDYRIMNLQIYPVQALPDGIRFVKSLKIRLSFSNVATKRFLGFPENEQKIFQYLTLNGSQVSQLAPAVYINPKNSTESIQSKNLDNRIKIFVKEEGIYKITGEELIDAGIDLSDIDPRTLRLTNKGKDVPLYVAGDEDLKFDREDFIEFWGKQNEKTYIEKYPDLYSDPFSDLNVYWLSWGGKPGVRIVEESGAIVQTNPALYNPAYFYPYTVHFEKNAHFERLGYGNTHNLSYEKDLWFFDNGIQSIGKKGYQVELIYPDSSSFNPVVVEVNMTGKSLTPHNTMVWLNQQLVGHVSSGWFSQNTYHLSNAQNSMIKPSDLIHGLNTLEIQMPTLAPDGKSDYILFNWANITYDRQYKAYKNKIKFTRPSPSVIYYPDIFLYQFEIENFTRPDIEIYKKGLSKIVNFRLESTGEGQERRYKIIFQDEILSDNVEYLAITSDQKLKPVLIQKDEPYDNEHPELSLKSPSNSADYIIITHEKFYRRAKEYLKYRREQGLHVVLVKVQDIYDEFNYGIKSPLAIQKFLKYAFYNWDRSHRLKYVLLLGDANYNYKSYNTKFEDFVPTFFFQTLKFGAVATDLPYALISGDDLLPDLFVGRIPVMTSGDVSIVLDKIREYEQNTVIGAWRNQSLFISGNDRGTPELRGVPGIPQRPAFRTQNQRLINLLLPKNYTAFKLNTIKNENLQYDPNYGGTTDLIEYFDDGVSFVTFLGHGGGAIWADVQLLDLQDVDRMNNKGKYPFIASMTCFTGAFDNPGNPGLAQKLLLSQNKGSIAVFASSGLGWVANDYAMLWYLMQHIFQPEISVGEAVALAKIDYFTSGQYVLNDTLISGYQWGHPYLKFDMIYQYNLIGDPYIHLQRPDDEIKIHVDNILPQRGDTVKIQINAPFNSAKGYIELTNHNNEIVTREPLFYSTGQENHQLVIPQDFPQGSGFIRAYLTDNVHDAAGYVQIGVDYSAFDSVLTIPANPNAEDSVAIQVVVREKTEIKNVEIVAVLPGNYSQGDTIHLKTKLVGPNTYQTVGKIPPTYNLTTVYYFVYVTNSKGYISRMNFHYKVEETRPDPYIFPHKIRLVGEEKVKLGISIGNSGKVPAENVELRVYQNRQNYLQDQPFAIIPISVDSKDSSTFKIDFPFSLDVEEYQIFAVLDRYNNSPDFNRFNNLDSVIIKVNVANLTPELGSTYSNTKNDTLKLGSIHKFWLPPGAIDLPSAMSFRIRPFSDEFAQVGLKPVPLGSKNIPELIQIHLFNKETTFIKPYFLQIAYNKATIEAMELDIEKIKLYRWDDRLNAWVYVDAVLDTSAAILTAQLTATGFFAPFIGQDETPPRIELSVDGRHIRSKTLVSPNPVLNVVVEDESGLNILNDQIQLTIDDIPIPRERIFIPDSIKESNILGITLYPELEIGLHTFTIVAKDVNGNLSQKDYQLRVSDEFDLHVFGNYPNPFSDVTIFSYYITSSEIIDDLEIRIFTLSGRLIKHIKNDENTLSGENDPRRVGYNELMWDGTDDEGNPVANGVYFAVIRAKYQDEVKEKILKVAKLK